MLRVKRILFVASVYAHLAAFHIPFMKTLKDKGYEIHAAGSSSLKRKEELIEIGVICHDVDFNRLPVSINNKKAVRQLHNLFENLYFNLIHVHTPTAAFLTRYTASKYNQGKVLYTVHGFHFFKGANLKNWLFFYPVEKLAQRWTDGLIVMNKEDYNLGIKIGFREKFNLFTTHGVGVDLNEFQTEQVEMKYIKQELRLNENAVVISCVAELSSRKNQMFLLENWMTISSKCPNAHLLLIGGGNDSDKINRFITEKGIKNVYLLGFRRDISRIIASSDIVTLVSKHEGLPRCLMEAMACAKPIITTNVRGSRDLIDNLQNGIIVNLGDRKHLINGFIQLINDKKLRNFYGENGKKKILDYEINKVISEMNEIYSYYLYDKELS